MTTLFLVLSPPLQSLFEWSIPQELFAAEPRFHHLSLPIKGGATPKGPGNEVGRRWVSAFCVNNVRLLENRVIT